MLTPAKYLLMLLCFTVGLSVNAQISDLQKLAKGEFYSAAPIKDDSNNIKGYFLLYRNDEVAKNAFELEFVVLDENLNKVGNGFFKEAKDPDADRIDAEVTLTQNHLLVTLTDGFGGHKGYKRYRMLDLATLKISDSFIARGGQLVFKEYFDREWRKNHEDQYSERLALCKDLGLVVFSPELDKKTADRQKYVAHYDYDFNLVWKYVFDEMPEKKGSQRWAEYLQSDKGLLVLFVAGIREGKKIKHEGTVHFIDPKTGKLIKEVALPESGQTVYGIKECIISNSSVTLMGQYYVSEDYQYEADNMVIFADGFYKIGYDKNSFELNDNKRLSYADMAPKLKVEKHGEIKGEGYLYVHNIFALDNGKVLAACEACDFAPPGANDIYFLEFTPDFKLSNVFTVDKFRNKFTGGMITNLKDLEKYDILDLLDYQNLGDGEYLFFFNDNEKNTKNRKATTLYGIVHYDGVKFARQTLNLKTPASRIYAENAKKGYMLLFEDYDDKNKSNEIRLEKINY
jgi:hypothetical protein